MLDQRDPSITQGVGGEYQTGVPWRWLILAAFGLATSLLLTAGVVLLGYRGVASAERGVEPAPARPSGLTLVREIGGSARSAAPSPTLGTYPTLLFTPEPSLLASRAVQPGAAPSGAAPPDTVTTPEPVVGPDSQPPAPPVGRAPQNTATDSVAAARGASPTAEPTTTPTSGPSPTPTSTPLPVPTFPPLFHLTPSPTPSSSPTPTPTVATPTPTPARAASQSADDERPRVTIHLSDTKVDVGDTVTVTVTATDDRGLAWISWEADDSGDWELDSEHREYCDGDKRCSESWKVRVSQPGRHTLQARARDLAGNLSGGADIELKVVAKASPTPTPTPTPRR